MDSSVDQLPSWNDTATKRAIINFVEAVSDPAGPDFVPPAERIATFDNDGTLWAEQPMYTQAFFVLDRVRQLAPQHPAWQSQEPFAAMLRGDLAAVLAGGEPALLELVMATHAGMTGDEFERIATAWISSARHPQTGRLFTEMVYQPMLELLAYLRAHEFKTFIASAGGIEFMRPWAERVYGIPPEQVIGSSIKTRFELRDGEPVIIRLPELHFFGDKAGKAAAVQHYIGRRPIAAFGNSDGDLEMLQWTTAGPGLRLGLIVRHDDGEREFAYDRSAACGRLDRALDEAPQRGWTVVSIRDDWATVFPSTS